MAADYKIEALGWDPRLDKTYLINSGEHMRQVISREEARKLAPAYVRFLENMLGPGFDEFMETFYALKLGQRVIAWDGDLKGEVGEFVIAKVSQVKQPWHEAMDGPSIRVSDGTTSWRCDGCSYAYPVA